MPKKVIFF